MKSSLLDKPEFDEQHQELVQQYNKLSERYDALFTLNKLLYECHDIDSFYRQVHQILASLMRAENFTIALCDRTFETIEYVYHIDERQQLKNTLQPLSEIQGSLFHYLIEQGKPLLLSSETIRSLAEQQIIQNYDEQLMDWLAVPLMEQGIVVGIISVQSYQRVNRDLEEDLELENTDIILARVFDMDADDVSDLVTMDTNGELNIYYSSDISDVQDRDDEMKYPIFTRNIIDEGIGLTLNEEVRSDG